MSNFMDQRNSPSIAPMLLAVVGSVCGTVVTAAVGASPTWRLAGAAAGAALPPIVTTAGPYWRTRVTSAVLVTAAALFVTYGGFTLTDYVTNQDRTTFPVVDALEPAAASAAAESEDSGGEEPTEESTDDPATSTSVSWRECEGPLCMQVRRGSITCWDVGCVVEVVVENTGTVVLEVNDIALEGAGAESYEYSPECEDLDLAPGASCRMTVTFPDGGVEPAELVIHQNFKGPAAYVPIAAGDDTSSPSPSDVNLGLSGAPACSVEPYAAGDGGDILQVLVEVDSTGAEELPSVPYGVAGSNGYSSGGAVAVGPGLTSVPVDVVLSEFDYEQFFQVTVELDPNDDIAESDETDNARVVDVELPVRPDFGQDVYCVAS